MEIVVTDLTRFVNEDIVCMAGVDRRTRQCIRPQPYLTYDVCRRLGLMPGAILDGSFARRSPGAPHSEDRQWQGRRVYRGRCRGEEFRSVLQVTESPGVEDGFSIAIKPGDKYIPLSTPPPVSIITISLSPLRFRIVSDASQPAKIRANFTDGRGRLFQYLSITDLGFHDYARSHPRATEIDRLNRFIHGQQELFIRVGLSREHHAPDGRAGYWLQVNGIYTFPECFKPARCYQQDASHAP